MTRSILILAAAAILFWSGAPAQDIEQIQSPPQGWRSAGPTTGTIEFKTPHRTTTTLQGITFDSNFDNGSLLGVEEAGPNDFSITTYTEPGLKWAARFWFRFRLTGAAGRTVTLRFDRLGVERPVVRIGAEGAWRHTTAAEMTDKNTLKLIIPAEAAEIETAFYFPLGMEETYSQFRAIAGRSPHALVEEIGQSKQGRPMLMATITDRRAPDAGKHRVWVHSRAHPGEVTSTHAMLGFLEQVTEDSPLGERLRRHCIVNIVPLMNVDGVYWGLTRWNPWGKDLEDRWCEFEEPETQALKAKIDAFMAGPNPIEVSLNLHSTQTLRKRDTFFYKHLAPSVSEKFEAIQQRYIDAFDRATPLFDNASPDASQLEPCRFLESYYWNNWGDRVMAMTHEGHFHKRITDGEYITGDDYRTLGRAMAAALVEYFNLPE